MLEIIAILIIASCVYGNEFVVKDVESEPIQIEDVYQDSIPTLDSYPVMTINAEEWLCKYSDSMNTTNKQFKMQKDWDSRFIKLTGKISHIRNNSISGCYISINQQRSDGLSDGWCKICCYFFDDGEAEKALKFKPGDEITIVGYAKWDMGPCLINSTIR